MAISHLEYLRSAHREQLVENLTKVWDRSGVSLGERRERLARLSPGLSTASLVGLSALLANTEGSSDLEAAMLEIQSRLSKRWEQMAIPEEMRSAYRWGAGMALDEGFLAKCTAEVELLDGWFVVVEPILISADLGPRLVGTMLRALRTAPDLLRPHAEIDFGAISARPRGEEAVGGDGDQALAHAMAEVGELKNKLRLAGKALVDERAVAAEAADRYKALEKQMGDALQQRSVEEREAFRQERLQLEARAADERRALEAMLVEESARVAEVERQRVEAARKVEMMRKLDRASDKIREAGIREEKAAEAADHDEKLKDAGEYEDLLTRQRAMLADADKWMAHLNPPLSLTNEFNSNHRKERKAVDGLKVDLERNRLLQSLKVDLEELGKVTERLQTRAESDGIFVALKGVCAANVWKPKQLANMIVKGPGALKMDNLDADELDFAQLEHFLERKMIQTTKPGKVFFLQKVGSSLKRVEGGKTRIDIDRFVKAIATTNSPPIPV